MKPTAAQRFTVSKADDHAKRFPQSADGSWWMGTGPSGFTARAERELPRMRLARWTSVYIESFSEASIRKHARKQQAVFDAEDV